MRSGGEAGAEAGGEAGTTLVELLVALALMSLIALFIAGGVAASRGMASVLRVADSVEEAGAVRDHLRRTLGEAVTASLLRQSVRLRGSAEELEFVAPADPVLEGGGLVRVRLSVEGDVGGGLGLSEWRGLDRGDWTEAARRTPLLGGLASLRFEYLGPDGATAFWNDPDHAPRAVRILLEFPEGSGRRWTPLVVDLASGPA